MRRSAGWSTFPYTDSVGKCDLATVRTESTVNAATEPSCRVTVIRCPGRMRLRCTNTPSPYAPTVTCPRITDGPVSPGVGDPLYQPAGACAAIGGTATVPSGARPSDITDVSTPSDGMRSRSGSDRGMGRAAVTAGVALPGAVRPPVPAAVEDAGTEPPSDGTCAPVVDVHPHTSATAAEATARRRAEERAGEWLNAQPRARAWDLRRRAAATPSPPATTTPPAASATGAPLPPPDEDAASPVSGAPLGTAV